MFQISDIDLGIFFNENSSEFLLNKFLAPSRGLIKANWFYRINKFQCLINLNFDSVDPSTGNNITSYSNKILTLSKIKSFFSFDLKPIFRNKKMNFSNQLPVHNPTDKPKNEPIINQVLISAPAYTTDLEVKLVALSLGPFEYITKDSQSDDDVLKTTSRSFIVKYLSPISASMAINHTSHNCCFKTNHKQSPSFFIDFATQNNKDPNDPTTKLTLGRLIPGFSDQLQLYTKLLLSSPNT